MNSNYLKTMLVGLFGIGGALYVMTTVLTKGGNAVGNLALFGMFGCLAVGVLFPKGGIYLMVFLAGYSDLLKRMMVIESDISMLDITYVLGMAPMALAGVVISVFTRKIFQGRFDRRDFITLCVSTTLLAVGAAMGFLGGDGGLKALRIVADYGAFSYLIFVLPNLFPTKEEITRLMKNSLFIFVPVAIYGIWQRIFGLADFEVAYLLTGLSTESRQLQDTTVRAFSTLNAATSLTMVAAICVFLSLICRKAGQISFIQTLLLGALFTASCYMTYTRVGWVVLILSLILIPVMRSKIATVGMYVFGVLAFSVLVWKSTELLSNLHDWQDVLYGRSINTDSEQGLRIVTFSDRLIGFENMKRAENWQPFGVKGEGSNLEGLSAARYSTTFSHDAISGFLFKFGYVPLAVFLLVGLYAMIRLHRSVFRLPRETRAYAQLGLAGAFAALASLVSGGTVFQFPANIFFWMLFCLVLVCVWEDKRVVRVRQLAEASREDFDGRGFAPGSRRLPS